MSNADRNALRELGVRLAGLGATRSKLNLTGETVPGGEPEPVTRIQGLPVPFTAEGDILTLTETVDGDLIAEWTTPTDPGEPPGSNYLQYGYAFDGSGGWEFLSALVSGQLEPVFVSLETE
jgi:hypothetical protein